MSPQTKLFLAKKYFGHLLPHYALLSVEAAMTNQQQGGEVASRLPHKQKIAGSIPVPASNQ